MLYQTIDFIKKDEFFKSPEEIINRYNDYSISDIDTIALYFDLSNGGHSWHFEYGDLKNGRYNYPGLLEMIIKNFNSDFCISISVMI